MKLAIDAACRTRDNPSMDAALKFWADSTAFLRSVEDKVPAAGANAWLLEQAVANWGTLVLARTSMHDLLFTRLGDPYPWALQVVVSWLDGVYKFQLIKDRGILITADRCFVANAPVVLDSFLHQLTRELGKD